MHFLWRLGPGLLVVVGLLVFVVPFLDLPFSMRLKAAPSDEGRLRLYRLIIGYLWAMAVLCRVLGDEAGMRVPHTSGEAAWLFGARWRECGMAALVAALFAVVLKPGVDCLLRPRRIGAYTRSAKALSWLLPHDAQQRRWFAGLSITAGICEEWILRGFVLREFHVRAGWSLTAALVVSSVLFGWNHLYQGWYAVVGSTVIGLGFGVIALLSGGLLVPMVLHSIMDLQTVVFFRPDAVSGSFGGLAGGAG